MSHLTELQLSMYADGALVADELITVQQHLAGCDVCGKSVEAWFQERALIRSSVTHVENVELPALPKFRKPIGLREFAMVNLATGGLVWFVQFLWKTLFGELATEVLLAAVSRLSIPVPDSIDVVIDAGLLFVSEEGFTMISNYIGIVGVSLALILSVWIVFSLRRLRAGVVGLFLALLTFSVVVPEQARALEILKGETLITVSEDTVIDDTVIAAGETIVIDGDIEGDLWAFGRRVVVNGDVGGNVATFGESISIRGDVGGLLFSASSALEINDVSVSGDLVSFANHSLISKETEVGGNVVSFAETVSFAGQSERDLIVFAEAVEVSGQVAEDLDAFVHTLNLLAGAQIGGDLRFRGEESDLQRSPSAVVGGMVEFLALPEEFSHRSRYLTGEYYVRQLARLAAAFLAGLVLLWSVPGLRDIELGGGIEGLKTAGIGLVALASLPIIIALFAITLVGIPIAVIGLFTWVALIYFAKIVLAYLLGSMILAAREGEESMPLNLLVGLLVVIVVVSLPGVGGPINFLLTVVGTGMLVSLLLSYGGRLSAR